jgi:hypothetical protein
MAKAKQAGPIAPEINPFDESHYQLCNGMLQCHNQAERLAQRLAAAGFHVADYQAEMQDYADLAKGVKQHFFPRRP